MTTDLVASVVAGLLVTWVLLIVGLFVLRPQQVDLQEAKRFVPDVLRLVGRLARDPSFGRAVRVRLLLLVAYLASPVDLVPDFIPLVGYADDLIVLAIALRSVVRHVGARALDEHWTGTAEGLLVVRRLAGVGQE